MKYVRKWENSNCPKQSFKLITRHEWILCVDLPGVLPCVTKYIIKEMCSTRSNEHTTALVTRIQTKTVSK